MNALRLLFVTASTAALFVACGGSDASAPGNSSDGGVADGGPRGAEQAGQSCTTATQCYPTLDAGSLKGTVTCLDRVTNGYCTHLCTTDADCCAVPGECTTGIKQVCAPFESTGQNMCFLSCEDGDVQSGIAAQAADGGYDGGTPDAGSVADAYCQSYASAATSCRSTGGGKNNRKVCIPKS